MVKIGDRIKILHMKDDPSWNKSICLGDIGTVIDIDTIDLLEQTQIWVQFDNGSRLALLEGIDRYERILNETHTERK